MVQDVILETVILSLRGLTILQLRIIMDKIKFVAIKYIDSSIYPVIYV